MFTWSGCSLIVIDTTVVLDQLLSRVQGSSLFRGYPLWVAMFLLLVIVGNFVLKLGLYSGLYLAILCSVISCAVLVLFGASWSVRSDCTWLLAVFISTHILLPVPAHLQLDSTFLNKLFGFRKLSNSDRQYIFEVGLVLLGAWFGTIPFILDWDRQWQQWPNTCLIGITAGHLLGVVLVKMKVHIHVLS